MARNVVKNHFICFCFQKTRHHTQIFPALPAVRLFGCTFVCALLVRYVIFKFEKCAKYANEMIDDVIHSTQYYITYIDRAIVANLQRRPMKLGRLIVLQKTHLGL